VAILIVDPKENVSLSNLSFAWTVWFIQTLFEAFEDFFDRERSVKLKSRPHPIVAHRDFSGFLVSIPKASGLLVVVGLVYQIYGNGWGKK
jgi:hypothetical protein